MLKVTSLLIEKFRRFPKDAQINIGNNLTLIVGQNATSKSTLLGMLCQPFEFEAEYKVYTNVYNKINKSDTRTISGQLFQSDFSNVFRMSNINDDPKTKKYTYYINFNVDGSAKSLIINSEKREDQKNNKIRFVVGKTRKKGEGNYPHPVIYLGLNRLYPLANSTKIDINDQYQLTDDEKEFYSVWQKKITILGEDISPEFISSDTKDFLGCKTNDCDAETNSAGQDNLGQIISAVLSFKRLKGLLKENYQGGILLIDELDATFHILAQEKLVDFLIYASREFDLQIICTTHSQKIIEDCCRRQKAETTIVSLYRRGKDVLIKNNATYDDIIAELSAIKSEKQIIPTTVLFEDYTASLFFKYITRNKFNKLLRIYATTDRNSETCLPSDTLLRLSSKNIPDFNKIIFIIDADKKQEISKKHKRIAALPGNMALEKEMYHFLSALPETDFFWSQELGGYNKQSCFRDFPTLTESSTITEYKQWFLDQSDNWGRGNVYLYKRWSQINKESIKNFIMEFSVAYKQALSKPIDKTILAEVIDAIDSL